MAAADQATANSGDTERLSPELHALPRRKPWELRSLPLRQDLLRCSDLAVFLLDVTNVVPTLGSALGER